MTFRRTCLSLVLLAALPTGIARAQNKSLKEVLPASTLFYMSAPDLEGAFEQFKQAALFKIWNEPEMKEFMKEPLAKAREEFDKALAKAREGYKAGQVPVDPDEVLKLRLKGFSIGLADVVFPSEKGPMSIGLVAALDFGETQPQWKKLIDGLLEMGFKQRPESREMLTTSKVEDYELSTMAPGRSPVSANWAWVGSQLVFGLSPTTMTSVLKGLAGKDTGAVLSKDADYTKTISQIRAVQRSSVEVFIKPKQVFELMLGGLHLAAMNPDFAPGLDLAGVRRAVDHLGFFSITAMASALGYDSKGRGVAESFVLCPEGERKGLVALGSGAPLDVSKLSLVPKDASSFSYSRMGISSVYSTIIGAVRAYSPELADQGLAQVGELEKQIGIKIQDDLFAQLGDELLYYTKPNSGMMSAPEMGILIGVRDGKRVVDSLLALAKLSKGTVTITEKKQDELTIYSVDVDVDMGGGGMNPLAMFMPSFAVHENYLVAAFSRADVKTAIKRFGSPAPGSDITANKAFEPYKEKVMKGGFTTISFTDWATTFEGYYTMLTGLASFAPIPEEVPIDLALLPTSETFTKHFFGSISLGRESKEGFHASGESPFGPEIVVGIAGAAAAGTAVSAGMRTERRRIPAPVRAEPGEGGEDIIEVRPETKKEEKKEIKDPAPPAPARR